MGLEIHTQCTKSCLPVREMVPKAPELTCVHAKIQGMARSVSTPPLALRLDGLLPMFMRENSVSGVTWRAGGQGG